LLKLRPSSTKLFELLLSMSGDRSPTLYAQLSASTWSVAAQGGEQLWPLAARQAQAADGAVCAAPSHEIVKKYADIADTQPIPEAGHDFDQR
jgi:hypothetical protein